MDFLRVLRISIEDEPTKAMGLMVGDFNSKAEHEKSFKIGSALERCVALGRFQILCFLDNVWVRGKAFCLRALKSFNPCLPTVILFANHVVELIVPGLLFPAIF